MLDLLLTMQGISVRFLNCQSSVTTNSSVSNNIKTTLRNSLQDPNGIITIRVITLCSCQELSHYIIMHVDVPRYTRHVATIRREPLRHTVVRCRWNPLNRVSVRNNNKQHPTVVFQIRVPYYTDLLLVNKNVS